ncbi:hypothetical protein GCM10009660_00390 [Catellatospora bangladeshensis]
MGTRFWRAFGAYSVNAVGDEFYALALPLVLLGIGYSAASATFLRAVVVGSTVAAGFLIGYVVDRHAPDRLLTASYLGSAAALGAAVAAIAAGADGYLVCLFAGGALGLMAALSAAGMDAGVPRLVGAPDRVPRGYSLVESARTAAVILGPAAAGVAAASRDLAVVVGIAATAFALAAGLGWNRRAPAPARRSPAPAWQQIAQGLRAVVRRRRLRLGITLSLLVNVTLGAEQPLFLARMVQDFALSPATTSAAVVTAGVVAVAASLVLARWATTTSPRRVMLGAVAVIALCAIGVGAVDHPWVVAALYCALSAATVCYTVHWRTYRQGIVEPELLGRVSATSRSLAYSGVVVGAVVVGALQQGGAATGALLVAGGVLCAAGVAAVTVAVQRADRAVAPGSAA